MKQYKHIIWDWNGTLLDDLQVSMDALNQLLIQEGKEIVSDPQEYRKVFQFPVIRYYEYLGFDFSRTPFSIIAQRYMDYYQPHSLTCHLHDGALSCLKMMKEKGYHLTLLSASDETFLKVQLSQYPLEHIFDEILGLDHIHADSKQKLAQNFVQQYHQEDILFIGDSVHDYEVASACGCDCILVACGHEHIDKLIKTQSRVVSDLNELASLF